MKKNYGEIERYEELRERRYWNYLGAISVAFAALYYWLFFG